MRRPQAPRCGFRPCVKRVPLIQNDMSVPAWASSAVVSLIGSLWCAMSFTELVQIRFWRMGDGRLVKHAGYSCGWLRCSLVRPFLSIDPFTKTIPNKVAFKIMPRPDNVSDKMPSVRPRYQIYIPGKVLVTSHYIKTSIALVKRNFGISEIVWWVVYVFPAFENDVIVCLGGPA